MNLIPTVIDPSSIPLSAGTTGQEKHESYTHSHRKDTIR